MTPRSSAPRFLLAACAGALALCALPAAPAHAEKPKLHLERADTAGYPLIKASLTFVEADGRLVTGKAKEDFKLIFDSNEQGVAQDVKTFDQLGQPIYMVIVAQISGAMHEVFDDEKRGIKQLASAALDLKGTGKDTSKVALIAYSQDSKRVAELGKPEEIDGAASGLTEDTDATEVHLLNAIGTAIDILNSKLVPDTARKLIVVFSDGIDASSSDKNAFAALGKRARTTKIVVDTIGFAPFEPGKLKNVAEIAKQTNGNDRLCKSAQEVASQFANVADEIKKQYLVLFSSVIAGDSKEHTIQVVNETSGAAVYSNNVNELCVPPVIKEPPGMPWWLKALIAVGVLAVVGLVLFLVLRKKPAAFIPMEEPEEVAAAPAPSAQRTMALDVSAINRGPTVGWIVGMTGRYVDRTFKLLPTRTVIGSSTEADVQIEDGKISRKHCEIRFDGSTYRIVDLGSTNGIVLNDKKVPQGDLIDGDLFRLGGVDFKFKSIN